MKQWIFISIHALREEGDPAAPTTFLPASISIHALREEGDRGYRFAVLPLAGFLSTPSARRATGAGKFCRFHLPDFYPRPPRGGRRARGKSAGSIFQISIHALREEGDSYICPLCEWQKKFLSTPSARRATRRHDLADVVRVDFYPRPPRGGRHKLTPEECQKQKFLSTPSARRATSGAGGACKGSGYFYPRPPRGGRPARFQLIDQMSQFLSTPSARRATCSLRCPPSRYTISIHALREEGDSRLTASVARPRDFYPRPPRGGRPSNRKTLWGTSGFLSTPSARRATYVGMMVEN